MTTTLPSLLKEQAVDRANILVSRFEDLCRQPYPVQVGLKLSRAGHAVSQRVRDEAVQMAAIPAPSDESRLRTLHTFLRFLETVLVPLCQAGAVGSTLWELSKSLQRLVDQIAPDTTLLLHSTAQLNYGWEHELGNYIHRNFSACGFDDILDSVGIASDLWFLSAAAFPPNGILTHTVLAHELAHGIYSRQQIGDSLSRYAISKITVARMTQLINDVNSRTVSIPTLRDSQQLSLFHPSSVDLIVRSSLYSIVANWVEELACDTIGLCLFGPAFLFAQLFFLPITGDLDSPSLTHPTPRMRLVLMINTLLGTKRGLGFRLSANPDLKGLLEPRKRSLSTRNPRPTGFYGPAFDAVFSSQGEIVRQARSVFRTNPYKELKYSVAEFETRGRALLNAFAEGLPGNSYWDESTGSLVYLDNIVSCLNAAWLLYEQEGGQILSSLLPNMEESERKTRFYDLVEKSVEYIELRQTWLSVDVGGTL